MDALENAKTAMDSIDWSEQNYDEVIYNVQAAQAYAAIAQAEQLKRIADALEEQANFLGKIREHGIGTYPHKY